MNLNHVTILPQGDRYCLRVGIFLTSIGEDTARAMRLPAGTRFDGLDKGEAERLAELVDEWIWKEWAEKARKKS